MPILFLLACGGFDPVHHDDRLTAWVEFVPTDEMPARMQFAADHDLDVAVAIAQDVHTVDDLRAICRAADDAGVGITLWPLLSKDDGYWANQANVDQFADWTREIVEDSRTNCRHMDGVTIDLEMTWDRALALSVLVAEGGGVVDIAQFVLTGVDEAAYSHSVDVFGDLIADVHDEGLRAEITTLPMLADDVADGDNGIALALGTPVEGLDADAISIQVYRSTFDDLYSAALADPTERFGPGLVASYAASATDAWGDRAAVDLGLTGFEGADGLDSAADLQDDVAAALGAGIPVDHIAVYSLEGLDGKADADAWLAVPEPSVPADDPATDEIRGLFHALDGLR
jgi:hypothetical protein